MSKNGLLGIKVVSEISSTFDEKIVSRFNIPFLLAIILFNCPLVSSQELSVKWSAEFETNYRKDLCFNRILGEDNKNVYLLFSSDTLKDFSLSHEPDKKKLIAFDKQTFLEVASVPLKGFSGVDPKMKFHTFIVRNNAILLFWTKETKEAEELYLEVLDPALKTIQSIRKIYTNTHAYDLDRGVLAKNISSIVVRANPERMQDLLIGGEIQVTEAYVRFEYTLLNAAFELSSLQTTTLPVKLKDKSYGLSCFYEYLSNGDVLVRSTFTAEEGKGVTKNTSHGGILLADVNPYHTISYLKTSSAQISTIELPITDLTFGNPNVKSAFINGQLKIFGLYTEEKDKTPKGIFCGEFTIEDLSTKTEYIRFEQLILDSLYGKKGAGYLTLQGLTIDNNRIVFFLIHPMIATTHNDSPVISAVLGYDFNHKFQWFNKVHSTPSPTLFYKHLKSAEIQVFYCMDKIDKSKKFVRAVGENIIGYSSLNTITGEIIGKKEILLEKPIFFRNAVFMNGCLYAPCIMQDLKQGIVTPQIAMFFLE